jgi:hypothetical protein
MALKVEVVRKTKIANAFSGRWLIFGGGCGLTSGQHDEFPL